jgi:hypothetical protein
MANDKGSPVPAGGLLRRDAPRNDGMDDPASIRQILNKAGPGRIVMQRLQRGSGRVDYLDALALMHRSNSGCRLGLDRCTLSHR